MGITWLGFTIAATLIIVLAWIFRQKGFPSGETQPILIPAGAWEHAPGENEIVDVNAATGNVLQPIYFAFNRSVVRGHDLRQLEKIARMLKESSTLSLVLEGHCDEWGNSEYNIALGKQRANAVKHWLVSNGVEENRIDAMSVGSERAIKEPEREVDHAKNRRVDFRVVGER